MLLLNECKRELYYGKRLPDDNVQQPIWNNCNLICKGNSVFFKTKLNQEYYTLNTCLTATVTSDDWNILQILLINLTGYVDTKFLLK